MRRFILILLLILAATSVCAQETTVSGDPYTVSGIQISNATTNAATARDIALTAATRQAYEQLQQRMSLASNVDDAALARYVQDFGVDGEKISANRYIGTFTIRFRPTIAGAAPTGIPAMTAMPAAGSSDVPITFAFAELPEWQAARVALQSTTGVRGIQVTGLRRNYVDASVRYNGDATGFTNALAAQGIMASAPISNDNPRWFLKLQR